MLCLEKATARGSLPTNILKTNTLHLKVFLGCTRKEVGAIWSVVSWEGNSKRKSAHQHIENKYFAIEGLLIKTAHHYPAFPPILAFLDTINKAAISFSSRRELSHGRVKNIQKGESLGSLFQQKTTQFCLVKFKNYSIQQWMTNRWSATWRHACVSVFGFNFLLFVCTHH